MSSVTTSSAAPTATSRATQYTVLNASLEKLQKNLETLEQNVEITVVQSEWTKRLLTIHSSFLHKPDNVENNGEISGSASSRGKRRSKSPGESTLLIPNDGTSTNASRQEDGEEGEYR
ncbi:hypothetical protein BGZ80_008674 [Entomortierella chlamydospora]|uniref:Uncharacterized protein n=1 Tax=Entomortierella chlamydospora TaxID=101097 RepID=A0A9P6MY42_9FUNG|nr:hypothetical protein BGZ80_008674 [Entomortierella chlamydospora]